MTYCVAISVEKGLVFASDSRTNAGVDNVATYGKMHTFGIDGDRQFVVLTAGKRQGTIGKSCMGIYVRKRDGGRIWYGSSVVRFVGYIISWIPLGLGYLMAAFSKKKLALHDIIAGTEVAYGTPSGAPAQVMAEVTDEVDHDAVTEVLTPASEPEPFPAAMAEARPSRVPEIMVGTGLLLIAGSMAIIYMR